ncbi:hypothetical protein [Cohnella yongneupensis]|uniref:Uncharacterized protein n=1 Tax=Cohnella yongneupensis TaxID=425006 RepID=A0ABW0R995_9BACL
MLRTIRRSAFLIVLLIGFVLADKLIAAWDPVSRYDAFSKNDFQRTVDVHPDKVWPKVIFGNSSVIAAYDETKSTAGYVNLGMNYGKITDLDAMLRGGFIHVGEELVIGLNLFAFLDELPTDPSYPWHRRAFEPYLYFNRDQLTNAAHKYVIPMLKGESIVINRKKLYAKELYYGTLKPADLQKKMDEYKATYYKEPIDSFARNLDAFDDVIAFAKDNGIRVRVLWMPWNRTLPSPPTVDELKAHVKDELASTDFTYTDWMDKFEPKQFHDLGHLNVERGRPAFTKELDLWAAK